MNSKVKIALVVLAVIAFAAAMKFLPVKESLERFAEWTRAYPVKGPIYLGVAYVLLTVVMVPGSVLTLGAGTAFGLLKGFIVVSIASVTGASLAFLLGRTLLRGWVSKKIGDNPKFKALDQAIGDHAFKIVLLTRLSPIFPFNMLNYMYGLTRVRFVHYFFASWIGMIPGTLLYVGMGATIGGVFTENGTGVKIMWGVGILAAVVVTVLITRIAKKALDDATGLEPEPTPQKA